MSVRIHIPTPMRQHTDGQAVVEAKGASVQAVLDDHVFLDGSQEAIVHHAAAAEALEYIAGYLQRLRGPERQRVREDMECLATYARHEKWPRQAVLFLKSFLTDFGIIEKGG